MDAATIYQRFVERAPAAVLVHGLIESCLSPAFLDATVASHLPASPKTRQLAFSHLVEILLPVVFESKKSVGQSYRDATHRHAVATLKCAYQRLAATPTAAVAALVEAVAERIGPLPDPHPPGTTRFLTLDGNHPAATQNRLADLAGWPAALPGQAMVLRDQATGVFLRALLHDDGHANERSRHHQLPDWCGAGDVVIADSCFCTEASLIGMRRRGAGVIVRHHGGVGLTRLGERRDCGRVETGQVYETRVRYARTRWEFRLVEVELDRPTREGHPTIGALTDVAAETLPAVGWRRSTSKGGRSRRRSRSWRKGCEARWRRGRIRRRRCSRSVWRCRCTTCCEWFVRRSGVGRNRRPRTRCRRWCWVRT